MGDFLGIGPIATLAGKILDMFPNAQMRAEVVNKLQDFATAVATQQSAVNAADSASGNWFQASWRPLCGYVCIAGLCYSSIIAPVFGLGQGDTGTLVSVLVGMLGLGTLRTVEKISSRK